MAATALPAPKFVKEVRMQGSQSAAVVECEELSVSYGEALAVDKASFDVRPGEVFGLLGPNGAGKTSVIRALTTIVHPSGWRRQSWWPRSRKGAGRPAFDRRSA